ncbi:MAG: lipid-A-disaccharide synthase [Verrucomicrobiota bacterium]|nr:lipid-A-disaccharide synthase [Verrucomicrobiota bacterium]
MKKKVLVVAGEMSGDQHAARLIREVNTLRHDVEFYGIGGNAMGSEGVRILVDAKDMAVIGLWEVLARYRFFRRVLVQMIDVLKADRPDAVLLVDYPGFNLRLAKAAHRLGIPVLYYISPQVWAWHRSRIPKIANMVDVLMVIFPFEVDVFKGTGLKTIFVGHPLVESVRKTLLLPESPLPWPAGSKRVAILPGSRRQEIERILPVLLDTAAELYRRDSSCSFMIAAASEEAARLIHAQVAQRSKEEQTHVAVVAQNMRAVVRQAHAAMVCSGTATVETALLKCPMIIVYRAAPITYWIGRKIIRVQWLGMVNLIANRTLCPEFIQGDARPGPMADALEPLLVESPAREAQLQGLTAVACALEGNGGVQSAGAVVAEAL